MNYLASFLILTIALLGFSCAGNSPSSENPKVFHATGKVLDLDKQNGSVTIDHGDIEGLMSAMTMDFDASDRSLLENIAIGDAVEFSLRRNGDRIEIVSILKTGKQAISGAEVYRESCARCHGDKGEGAKKGIPLIEGHALDHPEEDFLKQVRKGGEDMPSFEDKLSGEEIEAVVKYVRNEIQKGLRKEGEKTTHKH